MIADVVVFSAEEVQDRSQYTDPHHYSVGVVHVLVNGTPVLEEGLMTGALPGRFVERVRTRR
jgi:N-acyl-D-aspartate/D-glutamate deacylase